MTYSTISLSDEPEEDVIPQEFLDHALEKQLNADEFDVPAIIDDAYGSDP